LRGLATDASDDALTAAFPDIDDLASECRFADCTHEVEPGCAVKTAAETGDLDPARLASYRKLVKETAFERRRADPLAQRAEAQVWKARNKEQRRTYRERNR
jgi:ribosome biogenesis GTPase